MNTETIFTEGFYLNKVSDSAPAYIITNQSINVKQAIAWLTANQHLADERGYIKIVGKESQAGKRYFQVDTYKPKTNTYSPMDTTYVGSEGEVKTVPQGKGIDMSEFTDGAVPANQLPPF